MGRQELHEKIPKILEFPPKVGAAPQPIGRFVSRDHVLVDFLPVPPPPKPLNDTLNASTLGYESMCSQEPEIFGDTLMPTPEGCPSGSVAVGMLKALWKG